MQKVFTIVQRILLTDGIARAHVGNRGAFLTNPKCTTAKREVEGKDKVALRVFSYNVTGVKPGDNKLYVVVRKVDAVEGTLYLVTSDKGFLTRLDASRELRALGGGKNGDDDSLIVYSFPIHGAPAAVPVIKDWNVVVLGNNITIKATSQDEANKIVLDALAGLK